MYTRNVGSKMTMATTRNVGSKMTMANTRNVGSKMTMATTRNVGSQMTMATTRNVGSQMTMVTTVVLYILPILLLCTQVLGGVVIPANCVDNSQCDVAGNQVCVENQCTCRIGYSIFNNMCYKDGTLNGFCNISDRYSCSQVNSTCNSDSVRCACVNGFTLLADERNNLECVPHGYVGGVCLKTEPTCLGANSTCVTLENLCLCIQGFTRMKRDLCVVDCGKLPNITNGCVEIRKDHVREVIEAFYTCNDGHVLIGDAVRMCMENTTYNGTEPVCNVVESPLTLATTEATTSLPTCAVECLNGGSCILNVTYYQNVCACPSGYSGSDCGIKDPCVIKPCPDTAIECVPSNDNLSRTCICPAGFKGYDCATVDVPVSCVDQNVTTRLDLSPPSGTSICLPKAVSNPKDVCFNPEEGIVYTAPRVVDIFVANETDAECCILFANQMPIDAIVCIDIMAFEADDLSLRPWINATSRICFILNSPPVFQPPFGTLVYNVRDMGENTTVVLSATDPEQQTIGYDVIEVKPVTLANLFTVQRNNLVVVNPGTALTTASLDVEVKIKLADRGIPSLSSYGALNFRFVNESMNCSVSVSPILVHVVSGQNGPFGTLARVTCARNGSPVTSAVFQVSSNPTPLFVNLATGDLTYNLQWASFGTTDVTVKAEVDVAGVKLKHDVTFVVITGDLSPTCTPGPLVSVPKFVIPENALPTSTCSAALYTCTDPADLNRTCAASSDQRFQIRCQGNTSTEVKLCVVKSVQGQPGVVNVSNSISNKYGVKTLFFDVNVTNVNDAPVIARPIAGSDVIALSVYENETVGTSFKELVVNDPDVAFPPANENLSASLRDVANGDLPFSVKVNDAQNAVSLLVAAPLCPCQVFNILLTVTDRLGLSDTANVTVHVMDINEAPICDSGPLTATASVRDPVGFLVTQVTCNDPDFTPEFASVVYNLDGDHNATQRFSIDNTGSIRIRQSLADMTSSNSSVTLKVTAVDGGGLSASVTVTVQISNTFPPECNNGNYVFDTTKSEMMEFNVCFTVPTNCSEPVKGETIRYSFTGGNGTALFRLNADAGSSTNFTMSVCTTTNLKNKYGTYEIVGVIRSSYGERQFRLRINVNDVNDVPVFLPTSTYTASTFENVPIGTTILKVTAEDPDSGLFGAVTYTLDTQSPAFSIDSATGLISVSGVVDAEVRNSSTLIVKAVDGAPVPLQATATVSIEIKDINDNPPVCAQSSVSVRLDLTAPVGALVATLACSDADVWEEYKKLKYAIQSPSSGFSVNQTGHLTLTSVLPREITEHVIRVNVTDVNRENNAQFTTTVTVTLTVNNQIQPVCKPAAVVKTLPENAVVGSCLDSELLCEDPTSGTVTLVATSGSASGMLEVRTQNPGAKLGLNACIFASMRGRLGKFELIGIVTNGLANTTVMWTFTVTNVNDAPVFYGAPYNVTVDELKPADTVNPILVMSVSDPDTGLGNQTFELVSVEAVLTNNAQFNGVASSLVFYLPQVYSFYALMLNATERNLYTYRVNASDGAGLSTTTTVNVHVKDLNSAPSCGPTAYTSSIDIMAEPGKQLIQIRCWDTDIEPKNKRLQYNITAGDVDKYFNVTSDGVLVLSKRLPRASLYQTGSSSLSIRVQDSADVPLGTGVTATISVNNKIPAVCSLGFTPPGVWVQGRCAVITMDCTDPTLATQDHLSFTTSGNFTQGFDAATVEGNKITMCFKLVSSGTFEIVVDVYNGLSTATYRKSVVVNYSKATPVFDASRYVKDVNENVAVGSLVFTASATSENLIGSIVYRVRAAEPDNAWTQYFRFNGTSGALSTNSSLKPLANKQYTLTIEAEDTGSKLKSETSLQLSIIDINEPPQCTVNANNANNVPVEVDVGTVLATFTCTDADAKPEYSTLHSSLQTNTQVIALTDTGPSGSIVTSSLLGVTQRSYVVTLKVQDEGGLQFVRVINVTVNLLPPPVQVEVTEISHNHATVAWSYARTNFSQVTNSYIVTLQMTGGSTSNFSVAASDAQRRRLENLKPETNYSVVVTALTSYGERSSSMIRIKTLAVPVLSHVTATIHAQQIPYDDRLRDPEKQYYFETATFVRAQLEFVLKQPRFKGFTSLEIKGFRPTNSIYVDFVVAVNQSGSAQETTAQLNATVTSGWVGNMSVDSTYFIVSSGATYVKIANVTYSPTNVYNGTNVELTCNVVTVGYDANVSITYWWTFKGVQIRPTSGSRFSNTSSIPNPLIPENRQMKLRIAPVLEQHAGKYECHVQDVSGNQSDVASIQLPVILQPEVLIQPTDVTILYDASVNVTCMTVWPYLTFNDFLWYRNGQIFEPSASAIAVGNSYATLIISGVRENVAYACAGRNVAGVGPKVSMFIHVLPKPNEPVKCPESRDLKGTTWPETVPGTTVTFRCPTGSSGEISRDCSETGTWGLPVYACLREDIQTIWDTVNNIKDGASAVNVSSVLDELSNVTGNADLYQGDIDTTIDTLDTVLNITNDQQESIRDPETTDFLVIASNLIDQRNQPSWQTRIEQKRKGAIDVPQLVELFIDRKFDQLQEGDVQNLNVKNIHVKVGSGKRSDYEFPDRSSESLPDWVQETQTSIKIPAEAFKGLASVHYASSFYRNITPILVKKLKANGVVKDIESNMDINSDIVAFQIKEKVAVIDPPAEITFQHFDSNYSNPICCYWDFVAGAFVTDGCKLVSTSAEKTVCACSHFTNFAILMSPGRASAADAKALSIISAVGCAISIFCLLITIIAYLLVWRYVKSDRAVLLLNLCVALIVSYALFLGGVDRVENEVVCTVISALLHYFYLAVFFMMLAYGVEIAISIIYVFATDSRLKWLLPIAWGAPAVIVAVSLGVTKAEGYGNEQFCWLSVKDGVLWAFVGPALLIILINTIIVIAVMRKMFKSSAMMTKSDKEKARLGVRSICVLLPILGLTWVFGVFSVNEETVAFQYIFAILNALQGVFIFVFHCVFNKQLKDGLKQRNVRKKTLASFENTFKNQHSTGYASVDPKSTSLTNNTESYTTNPFLAADRQMKELTKHKKGTSNIYDNNVNNQKDTPNKAVDLDDVKISNILRESEVMGGTAGISSILDAESRPERSAKTPEEENTLRQSEASQVTNSSYDQLELGKRDSHQYTDVVDQARGSSKESGSDRSRNKRQGTDDEKLRQQEIEKAKKTETGKQEQNEKHRKEKEARDKEIFKKERKERERYEREREDERQRPERQDKSNMSPIHIGYGREEYPYSSGSKSQLSKTSRSSRSDDDYEGGSAQNISSISTALPQKYEHSAGRKKKDSSSSKKPSSLPKKKDKKKGSHSKDRSRMYEYPYETTYLGGQSRHASLENMNMQPQYGPYGHVAGAAGYQTGHPAHQKQQWGQYGGPYSYGQGPYKSQQTHYW